MVRFFNLLTAKVSLDGGQHAGLEHYRLLGGNLKEDVLLVIGYVPDCTVAHVFRRVGQFYGRVPDHMKLAAIAELKEAGHVSYPERLTAKTKLKLTLPGSLLHTTTHIARHIKRSKEEVAV